MKAPEIQKPSADERADASRLVTVAGHIANWRTTLPGKGRLARASAQTRNVENRIRLIGRRCKVFLEAGLFSFAPDEVEQWFVTIVLLLLACWLASLWLVFTPYGRCRFRTVLIESSEG